MAPPPRVPGNPGAYLRAHFPVGSTGGKGAPVAPKATTGWTHLSGALATGLPTAFRQAAAWRRQALRSLR